VVKLADMNPASGVAHKGHDVLRNVGAWSFYDYVDSDGMLVRAVSHYHTVMGRFRGTEDGVCWCWLPESVGWGSVSDQQGCNRIVAGLGGWYFQRAGGSKWVQR